MNTENVSAMLDAVLASSTVTNPSQKRDYKPIRYDLNGFEPEVHPEVRKMHREAQWFLNDILNHQKPRRWLSLLGASGAGKTHLASAVKAVLRRERPALSAQFWKWQKVVSMLRDGEWALVEHLVNNVSVLFLDDIGAENTTPAILSALNRIADGRLGKWTLITSNLLPDHIGERLDVRIASRLFRGANKVCTIANAPDYSYEKYKKESK